MKYPFLILILAIASMFFINCSTVKAMEDNVVFVLPESGTVINFDNRVPVRSSGGHDPPAVESNQGEDAARVEDRFEMAESGLVIDFNRDNRDHSVLGFSPVSPSEAPLPDPTTPAFQAFEMPESGHLIVFPRQVEWRRQQAAHMRLFEGMVSNTR